MAASKINKATAIEILNFARTNGKDDFHTLNSSQVSVLLEFADEFKYRKPKNANGSRGRYFHAYLVRIINRKG